MKNDVAKKKCIKYNVDYLKYGFIASPHNEQLSLCLICEKMLQTEP